MIMWLRTRYLRLRFPLGSVWVSVGSQGHRPVLMRVIWHENRYHLLCFSQDQDGGPWMAGRVTLQRLRWTRASKTLWTLAVMKGRWDGV